jgi:hypothetical protein
MFGSNPEQLRSLAAWLLEQEVEEVVMESTAQYWRPCWKQWNGAGSRYAKSGEALAVCREDCIWRRHNRTANDEDTRRIFWMPNAWSSVCGGQ